MQNNLKIGSIVLKVYTSTDINDIHVALPYYNTRGVKEHLEGSVEYLEGGTDTTRISIASTGLLNESGQETLEDLIMLLKLIKKYQ